MHPSDRYDSLIRYYARLHGLSWRLVKRLIAMESEFRPDAISPSGAVGLAQFMPDTWSERGEGRRDNPEQSIAACCRYLRWLYNRFPEIPDADERWRFAIAAFNCGRPNVNLALARARQRSGHPASYDRWVAAGSPPGPWQQWRYVREVLPFITGHHAQETVRYVEAILPESEG